MRGRERASRALVLIADDAADTREMYALYLNMVGYRVETATDGREAARFARVSRPDMIVMDLQMPTVDGWAAIRELQRDAGTANIPVIVSQSDARNDGAQFDVAPLPPSGGYR